MSIEGSSAFTTFLTYYVNALYDPITSSRNRWEFKENLGLFKRLLREYEKEYRDRMREEEYARLSTLLLPVR